MDDEKLAHAFYFLYFYDSNPVLCFILQREIIKMICLPCINSKPVVKIDRVLSVFIYNCYVIGIDRDRT